MSENDNVVRVIEGQLDDWKLIKELQGEIARCEMREKIAEDRGRSDAWNWMGPKLTELKDWARKQDEKVCKEFFDIYANGNLMSNHGTEYAAQRVGWAKLGLERAEKRVAELEAALLRPDRPVETPDFLRRIADRLVIHGDSENADFVLSLRERADHIESAVAPKRNEVRDD